MLAQPNSHSVNLVAATSAYFTTLIQGIRLFSGQQAFRIVDGAAMLDAIEAISFLSECMQVSCQTHTPPVRLPRHGSYR